MTKRANQTSNPWESSMQEYQQREGLDLKQLRTGGPLFAVEESDLVHAVLAMNAVADFVGCLLNYGGGC